MHHWNRHPPKIEISLFAASWRLGLSSSLGFMWIQAWKLTRHSQDDHTQLQVKFPVFFSCVLLNPSNLFSLFGKLITKFHVSPLPWPPFMSFRLVIKYGLSHKRPKCYRLTQRTAMPQPTVGSFKIRLVHVITKMNRVATTTNFHSSTSRKLTVATD